MVVLDRGVATVYYSAPPTGDVVRIDVPGFQGEISKDKGIDIEVGKDASLASVPSEAQPKVPRAMGCGSAVVHKWRECN